MHCRTLILRKAETTDEMQRTQGKSTQKWKMMDRALISWRGDAACMCWQLAVASVVVRGGPSRRRAFHVVDYGLGDKPLKASMVEVLRLQWTSQTQFPAEPSEGSAEGAAEAPRRGCIFMIKPFQNHVINLWKRSGSVYRLSTPPYPLCA